ncbi:DUF6879 family protein [Streptomyces sp. NPDC051219]|uniref:DUF6879 family protein n=1 Tax=Streptomyces sp. NPDC051219 TaxID=3155283 RepID=UPI003437DC05
MLVDGDEWQAKFRDFNAEAWRLEALPQYLVPQEAEEFTAFKNGARFPGPYEDSWTALIRKHVSSGGGIGRVHILTRPLSAGQDPLRRFVELPRLQDRPGQ